MASVPAADFIATISKYISSPSLVSITGSGGKTSLMFSLANSLARDGSVICTTTTKLCWPYQHEEAPFFVRGGSASGLRESVSANGSVLVGDHVACGKLTGIPPKLVDSFFRESVARHILVEADGAKGMSFKGYESHEPVVPSSTTHHIAVVGAEILASPISRENTFRLNLLMERWGVRERERISFDKLAEILESPSEYLKGSPSTATRMLLFNKCEILGAQTLCEASGNLSKLLVSFDIMAFVSLRRNIRYELTKLKRL